MKPPFTPKQPAKPVQNVSRQPVTSAPPAYRPNPVPKVLQLKPRPGGPPARPSQTIQRAEHGAAAAGGGGGGGGGPMAAAGRGGPVAFAAHGPMGAAGGGRGRGGGRGGRGGGRGRGRGDGGDGPAAAAVAAAAPVAGGGGGPMAPAAAQPPPAMGGRGRGARVRGGGGGARPKTVDVYRKEYGPAGGKQPSKRATARKAPYGGVAEPASQRLKARMGGEGSGKPGYLPPKDSTGLEIWNGSRKGLTWSDAIKAAMAPSKPAGCQADEECEGAAEGIDHKIPFSDQQTEIARYLICDGKHHWEASYKADAVAVYNNYDNPSNMRWSCTACNSSKGGVKGLYENQPKWRGKCPGASKCNYAPRLHQL